MDKIKELGQVMTPIKIIDYMIDNILNCSPEQIKNYLFLDNSCGNGGFIKALLKRGVPPEHLFACDIDEEISKDVKKLLPEKNFRLESFFKQKDWINKFDVVIGNPPFVRIHNISEEVKEQISCLSFCSGMYDLYYAFYDFGLQVLKENGILLYISPNGFVKNNSGKKMRDYIEQNSLLAYFEDFQNKQNFEGYSTYTCIVKLDKKGNGIKVPWNCERKKIGLSYNSIQNGLATLADKIFIQTNFKNLERDCIRPIIKASTGEIKECIFPPKTEEELLKYPKTYEYLLSHKDTLSKRSIKGNTKWFEFGRSQGLKNINNEKIVISTAMPNSGIKYYRVGKDFLVYSGLYITADDLNKIENELKSEDLLKYLIKNGKPMRGEYTQINATLLKNY